MLHTETQLRGCRSTRHFGLVPRGTEESALREQLRYEVLRRGYRQNKDIDAHTTETRLRGCRSTRHFLVPRLGRERSALREQLRYEVLRSAGYG